MDIKSLFKDFNISYSEQGADVGSPEFIHTKCVFCSDALEHLGWHISGEFVNCWICGGHSIEYALQKLLNMSRKEVNDLTKQYKGQSDARTRLNKKKTPKAKTIVLPGHSLEKQHKKYLVRRGFDPEYIAEKYRVLGTGITGEWKYRIIIPIYFRGKLVSFQGRDITKKQNLRYKSLEVERSVVHYKHTLYNVDNCVGDTVVVMEGPTDVWRWGDGGVATYSTTVTEWQVRLLSRYRRVFFMFDTGVEAQGQAFKAARKLAMMGISVEVLDLESERDPGELTEQEVKELKRDLGV